MGAWGLGSFDNDEAADWLAELTDQHDLAFVGETIAEVLAVDGYVEAPQASRALAAMETLAAALGQPTPVALTNDELSDWLARERPRADATMVGDAVAAIDRVMGADSELRELWEKSAAYREWQVGVAALREQLLNLRANLQD